MRPVIIAMAFLAAVAMLSPAARSAQPAGSSQAAAIQQVITSQLDAFRRTDADAAFAHASPTIQQFFTTPQRFIEMVERGYPQIFRSQSAQFLDLQIVQDRLVQRVLVRGAGDRLVVAAYAMVQVEGVWRIDGCWLVQPDDA